MLDDMSTFVRIVDSRSISVAARALRMSVAAVSRRLRALENELGAELVVRTTRSMRLTEAGEYWYEQSRRILRDIDDARVKIGAKTRGTLTVSAGIGVGMQYVVPRLPALFRAYPALSIDLRLDDHVSHLVSDGIDVAVRAGVPPPDSSSVIAHKFAEFERWLVAAPAYLKARGTPTSPEALQTHACIVQGNLPWSFSAGGETRTIEPRGPARASSPLVGRDLAIGSVGLAVIPEWMAAPEIAKGRLRRVLATWATPVISAYAIYRRELRGSPCVKVFVAAL